MTSRDKLSAEDWFQAGISSLVTDGPTGLKLGRLADHLGVTTGSFYWHFSGVDDFHRRMLDFWSSRDTTQTAQDAKHDDDPLRRLEQLIEDRHLLEVDEAIRRWARSNEDAARAIERIDRMRHMRVAQILKGMGLDSDTAARQAQIMVWTAVKSLGAPMAWRHEVLRELVDLLENAANARSTAKAQRSGSGGGV